MCAGNGKTYRYRSLLRIIWIFVLKTLKIFCIYSCNFCVIEMQLKQLPSANALVLIVKKHANSSSGGLE